MPALPRMSSNGRRQAHRRQSAGWAYYRRKARAKQIARRFGGASSPNCNLAGDKERQTQPLHLWEPPSRSPQAAPGLFGNSPTGETCEKLRERAKMQLMS